MLNYEETTVAERIRKSSDEEMAIIISDYCVGVVDAILESMGYKLPEDKLRYEQEILRQLRKLTTERPHVYTLDEMKAMRGQMVYVHYMGPCHGFYTDEYMPYYGDAEIGITSIEGQYSQLNMQLKWYNKFWIAMAYKPNGDERIIEPKELADDYERKER